MANLNNILNDIRSKTSEVEESIQTLFAKYENLYREGTRMFNEERTASNGNMDGLEEFFRLTQIIRRNRDVVGAITRGMKGLRPMDQFKFVEEDVKEKPKKAPKKPTANAPTPEIGPSPEINEKSIQNLKITTEEVAHA